MNANKEFIPYSLPEIDEAEISEVVKVLKSGWLTTGPVVKEFEEGFANFLGQDINTLAVNSATSGLHLALNGLGIKSGDEVIVPSHTFTASAEIVRYLGAEVSFVDIDPDTLTISVDHIEKKINNRTKAIIVVHFAGLSCDMESIFKIAKKYSLKVIEDAAHAFPSTYRGKLIGTLDSDATIFSFYANKTMTTGEGGMVVTKDKKLYENMLIMRLHGIDRDAFNRFQSTKPAWFYNVIGPGYKYNMTDIAASIGKEQLKKINLFLSRRKFLAKNYTRAFSGLPIKLQQFDEGLYGHAWHLYVVQLTKETKITRNQFIELLYKYGIGSSVHYIPLHRHTYWKERYNLKNKDFPNSEEVYAKSISIPLYTSLKDGQQDYIIKSIRKILT